MNQELFCNSAKFEKGDELIVDEETPGIFLSQTLDKIFVLLKDGVPHEFDDCLVRHANYHERTEKFGKEFRALKKLLENSESTK